MNAFLGAAEWWSRTLWALSWQIGVLVGIVWLASLVSRRGPPNFRYWLWCIVLARLCIPATLALPAGVSGDVRRAVETSAPAVLHAAQRTVMSPEALPPETGDSIPGAVSSHDPARLLKTRVAPGELPELSLSAKLALGWTAVSLGLLVLVVMKNLRVRRMLQGWPEVARPELLLLIDSLRSRCSIGRAVRVRMFPAAQASQGPALVGIWRPTILLPAPVAEHWSLDELEPVLLHELAHVKRWDLLVNLVQIIVQAVYFFHPLVWFVNARIRQERELVCDDLAVLHSGGRCKRYSQSFVRVLEEASSDASFLPVASAGMTERRKPLARRILRMMSKDYRLHRPLGWFSAIVLLLMSMIAIAVASERAAAPNAPASTIAGQQQNDIRAPGQDSKAQYMTEIVVIGVANDAPLPEEDVIALPPGDDLAGAAAKSLADAAHTPNETPKSFRLISHPSLWTSQGERGSVALGQEIPFRTSQATPAESDEAGGIQRKDVGLLASITVAPEDGQGKVGMDLRAEISYLAALTPGQESGADPANTRAIRSRAFDGHFVLDLQRGYLLKPDIADSEGKILFAVRVSPEPAAGEQAADVASPDKANGPGASVENKGLKPQQERKLEGRPRPNGHASVSGKVVDAATGEPVAGSTMLILREDTQDGILLDVAGDGSFVFKDIPGGSYLLLVSRAPDHVTGPGQVGLTRFTLGENEQKQDMVFKVRRGCSISGRVITEDGSPLPADKALGIVAWKELASGRYDYRPVGSSHIDTKDGSYRLSGLDGEPVYVQFADSTPELRDDGYPPVYAPGTFSRDEAQRVTFDKNGETDIKGVDIKLRKTGGLVLEGTVSSRDTGEPIAKTLIVVAHRDMAFDRVTTYTDTQGHYRLECLGPGEFQFHADATAWGFVRTRKLFTLTDAAPVTRLDVTLMTGATVSGSFVQEDGTPWHVNAKKLGFLQRAGFKDEGADCTGVWSRYAPGRVEFSSIAYFPGEGDYEQETMGFPNDSSFIVSGMKPGPVTFNFSPYADGKKVVRINYNGKDIMREGLELQPKQVIEGVQIVIGEANVQGDSQAGKLDDAALRARCADNLKQTGLVLKMFANEEKTGTFPALSSEPGELMFSADAKANNQVQGLYPEYVTDTSVLVCPASEEAAKLDTPEVRANTKQFINDHSYVYLGYAVTNDAEVKAFADAYRVQMAKGSPPLEDLPVAEGMQGSGGGNTLYRLRGGVERKIAKNANDDAEAARVAAQIPVLIERPGHHETEGGNVLYLDGTVRWVSSGVWPMTKATSDVLSEMMSLSKK